MHPTQHTTIARRPAVIHGPTGPRQITTACPVALMAQGLQELAQRQNQITAQRLHLSRR
jgi:hypothetical protein